MKLDVTMRVIGSAGVVVAFFILTHVSVALGVVVHFIADAISIPYFIRTKSWDVVIMISFLLIVSMSKIIPSYLY